MPHSIQPDTPWLRISQPHAKPRLRLFCFPYAGGAASVYRLWHQYLPTDIDVCAVQLPGRENRIRERPIASVDDLLRVLVPVLQPHVDQPFALFGHSMGSIIAFELAHRLYRQFNRMPTHLFVSGRRAPILPDPERPLHVLQNDETFLTELSRRYDNVPALLFEDAELRELFVPLLRADLTLVETYNYQDTAPLPCPIVALGGQTDPRASQQDLTAWQRLTTRDFKLHMLPGGHFYLNQQVQPLLEILTRHLGSNGQVADPSALHSR